MSEGQRKNEDGQVSETEDLQNLSPEQTTASEVEPPADEANQEDKTQFEARISPDDEDEIGDSEERAAGREQA